MKTNIQLTRVDNDVNGNPRFVCHFLNLINDEDEKEAQKMCACYGLADNYQAGTKINFEYQIALQKAKKIGGRKFHNKQYGGGIVFTGDEKQILNKINSIL